MTTCNHCGAEIRWANTQEANTAGQRKLIRLDNIPTIVGPNRFREVSYDPLVVEPVSASYEGSAYKRHDCRGR